jgi:hypothetical protein
VSLSDIASKISKTRAPSKKRAISSEARKIRDFILLKFKLDKISGSDKIREMGMARQLAEQYPNMEFWEKFKMPYSIVSLTFLTSSKGRSELSRQFRLFNYEPKRYRNNLKEDDYKKEQEELNPSQKIKSINDFLTL